MGKMAGSDLVIKYLNANIINNSTFRNNCNIWLNLFRIGLLKLGIFLAYAHILPILCCTMKWLYDIPTRIIAGTLAE